MDEVGKSINKTSNKGTETWRKWKLKQPGGGYDNSIATTKQSFSGVQVTISRSGSIVGSRKA